MRKIDIVACIMALLLTIALIGVFVAVPVFSSDTNRIHMIVFAQDPETEIEVRIGEGERRAELVDAGVTYMTYKTTEPTAQVWVYGSKETPRVDKGRDGDYYCMIFVQPPGDPVGERREPYKGGDSE